MNHPMLVKFERNVIHLVHPHIVFDNRIRKSKGQSLFFFLLLCHVFAIFSINFSSSSCKYIDEYFKLKSIYLIKYHLNQLLNQSRFIFIHYVSGQIEIFRKGKKRNRTCACRKTKMVRVLNIDLFFVS
jgi:hypothetical protein